MKLIKRLLNPPDWKNLRTTKPLSTVFGFDRGTPIDRYYIEKFLAKNSGLIKGDVLEIAEATYTKKFGQPGASSLILDYNKKNTNATIIADLTEHSSLVENYADCFICTQTFNFIYDSRKAIQGAHHLLKPGGVLLVTLAGLCQISRYDMDRWGDYWRFTTASANRMFGEIFGPGKVEVNSYGNVLSSVALMHGISAEELSAEEMDIQDENYQIIVTVTARK